MNTKLTKRPSSICELLKQFDINPSRLMQFIQAASENMTTANDLMHESKVITDKQYHQMRLCICEALALSLRIEVEDQTNNNQTTKT